MAAIACHKVRREFRDTVALDDVTLTVDDNHIFGLLGPNGSGKTTLLNQIQGLDVPTSGEIEVLGLDPLRDHDELVARLGSQHQESTSIPRLTVRETLTLYASFYPEARDVDGLIDDLSLTEKADSRLEKLSGGQRQRVFIALALVHNPELLLFDELTSALDPNIKRSIWEILKNLRTEGRTILLTTHSMEEAQELCDRVAIMDSGRILAEGSPAELIARHAPGASLRVNSAISLSEEDLAGIVGVETVTRDGEQWVVSGRGDFAPAVISELTAAGDSLSGLRIDEPSLEDVFLTLTGRDIGEETK